VISGPSKIPHPPLQRGLSTLPLSKRGLGGLLRAARNDIVHFARQANFLQAEQLGGVPAQDGFFGRAVQFGILDLLDQSAVADQRIVGAEEYLLWADQPGHCFKDLCPVQKRKLRRSTGSLHLLEFKQYLI